MSLYSSLLSCFFFNDTATTEIYTLSLHDALPICVDRDSDHRYRGGPELRRTSAGVLRFFGHVSGFAAALREALRKSGYRSEEHTSELQSHSDLVCRLLLEKKKKLRVTLSRVDIQC